MVLFFKGYKIIKIFCLWPWKRQMRRKVGEFKNYVWQSRALLNGTTQRSTVHTVCASGTPGVVRAPCCVQAPCEKWQALRTSYLLLLLSLLGLLYSLPKLNLIFRIGVRIFRCYPGAVTHLAFPWCRKRCSDHK